MTITPEPALAAPETPAAPAIAAVIGSVDSHGRALAKAVTWRAVGTMDTFLWAWFITHQPVSAGAIASTEIFTKIALYYVHERIWRVLKWAPQARSRSFVKAISWRLVGSLDTFMLSFIFTGKASYAVTIMSAEALTKIALYYFHERVWRRVAWGRLEAKAPAA